jgi:hypothetical protein
MRPSRLDSRNTTDIVSLADGLVAKWSKLVPEDAVAPSKKRKSAVTDPASVAPTPAKAKRPLVSSDDVPAHGSPSLPAVLPELTSLSSLAQEAMSSAKGKTPSPSAPSTAPTFGANGRRIVLSSPASAVAVSADVLVPGEGDPSAYGDKENGVLINPVRQVVGGHKRERGRRGGIRFPEKDDDLRLIRWFLRTDEPTKVCLEVFCFHGDLALFVHWFAWGNAPQNKTGARGGRSLFTDCHGTFCL